MNFDLVFHFEYDLLIWSLGVVVSVRPIGLGISIGPFGFSVEVV